MRIDLPVTGLVPFYLCYFFVLQGIDYFENLCLVAENSCEDNRSFSPPRVGVPDSKIALHVNVHFYTDKELMANSAPACQRACEIESEFLCRSYLYLGPPTGAQYNCRYSLLQ